MTMLVAIGFTAILKQLFDPISKRRKNCPKMGFKSFYTPHIPLTKIPWFPKNHIGWSLSVPKNNLINDVAEIDTEYSCKGVLLEVEEGVSNKFCVENEGKVPYKNCGKKRGGNFEVTSLLGEDEYRIFL